MSQIKKSDKQRIQELEDCLREIRKLSLYDILNSNPNIIVVMIDKVLPREPFTAKEEITNSKT